MRTIFELNQSITEVLDWLKNHRSTRPVDQLKEFDDLIKNIEELQNQAQLFSIKIEDSLHNYEALKPSAAKKLALYYLEKLDQQLDDANAAGLATHSSALIASDSIVPIVNNLSVEISRNQAKVDNYNRELAKAKLDLARAQYAIKHAGKMAPPFGKPGEMLVQFPNSKAELDRLRSEIAGAVITMSMDQVYLSNAQPSLLHGQELMDRIKSVDVDTTSYLNTVRLCRQNITAARKDEDILVSNYGNSYGRLYAHKLESNMKALAALCK